MSAKSIYDFKVKTLDGQEESLSKYKGKAMVIVNVASKCGFTPQYEGLEQLYKKYKDKDVVVLGFPCNQFGAQEPGDENEIKNFCSLNYSVTFPMFKKIDVNGSEADPLFVFLKSEEPGILGIQAIKWNFTKFLVDKSGKVVERFAPITNPVDLEKYLDKLM